MTQGSSAAAESDLTFSSLSSSVSTMELMMRMFSVLTMGRFAQCRTHPPSLSCADVDSACRSSEVGNFVHVTSFMVHWFDKRHYNFEDFQLVRESIIVC